MKLFLILCTLFSIKAFCYRPLEIELFMGPGYRRDEVNLKIYDSANSDQVYYQFKLSKAHSAQQALYINLIWDHFRWESWGDFAWLVDSSAKVKVLSSGILLPFTFKQVNGYEADGDTKMGYDLQAYKSRFFSFLITPFFGVHYWALATRVNDRKALIPPSLGLPSAAVYEEARLNHADLWGPYLEARFDFSFRRAVDIQLFYQYHFIFYRHKLEPTLELFSFPGSTVTNIDFDFSVHGSNAMAHKGGFDICFETIGNVLVGLQGYGARVFSTDAKTNTEEFRFVLPGNTLARDSTMNRAKFRWTIYSAVLYLGYRF